MIESVVQGSSVLYFIATVAGLFALGVGIGSLAVAAGVGGGVMFVPFASVLFPVHIDYIRGAGLMVALIGAASAAPRLLQYRFARARVSVPLALSASVGSVVGARVGLVLPTEAVMAALGLLMLGIAAQTAISGFRHGRSGPTAHDGPVVHMERGEVRISGKDGLVGEPPRDLNNETGGNPRLSDRIAQRWVLSGRYTDPADGSITAWTARNILPAMLVFVVIGGIGGALGVGGGWANVPVLSGLMGLPLKLAAATSGLIILGNSGAAGWVYWRAGALDPYIVVPAVAGMIAGTKIGVLLLGRLRPATVRIMVVAILVTAGVRTLWPVISGAARQ